MAHTPEEEKEIIEGWARIAEEYEPRPLTVLERHQIERAELAEHQAQETPFVLGKQLYSRL